MTEYDYLNGKKTILTADGKTPHILIIPRYNDEILNILGKSGRLKGEALKEYQRKEEDHAGRP